MALPPLLKTVLVQLVILSHSLAQPQETIRAPALPRRPSQLACTCCRTSRVDIPSTPSLEEQLSSGPVPHVYARSVPVARDNLRAPLPRHDHISDFRTNKFFSRERPGGPPPTASTYRPDLDHNFGDRDGRDRRDRDVPGVDIPPARYGVAFSRGPPPRRYSPSPPMLDRDCERERGRPYYPSRRSVVRV